MPAPAATIPSNDEPALDDCTGRALFCTRPSGPGLASPSAVVSPADIVTHKNALSAKGLTLA